MTDLHDFPLAWSDPSDVLRTWQHDDMHAPFCLAPLAWDYADLIAGGFAYRYERLALPIDMRAQVFNGYLYFSWKALVAESEEDALDVQYIQACRDHTPYASEYWERAVPQLRELYGWIADVAVEDLPADELADAWEGAWERAQRAWDIHFYAITGPYQVMEDLADLYESVVEKAPPGEAMRLIQGSIDELVDVDSGIGRLTTMAAASPELAAAIGGSVTPSIDELAALPGGQTFVSELGRFLEEHGHLGQGWDDLGLASWAEEPAMIVAEIAKRLERPVEPATHRAARLAGEADVLADAFRARLTDQPEKLAEFERLLNLARQIGRITETHNYWIDRMAQARLRTFAMRVGARLAHDGVIERPEDVLYVRRSEVPGVLRSPEDRRPLVADRKADHARWRPVKPPAKVGKPSAAESSGRFSGVRFDKEDEAIVRGTGASAGIVSGPARIVLGPDDFGRVRPGDIIVAPSSNPSWVPLFTIAGGLVTNTGGVLSHAAVVAREFDLPAVVGTGDATTRIVDGQMLELDGTTGYVRLSVTEVPPSRTRLINGAMLGLASGAILVPLNSTMLAVALPSISTEFGVGPASVASLVTLYLGAVAIALPASGSLGDRFGHRPVFLFGVAAFALASAIAATAVSFEVLALSRVLQAVSGALVSTSSVSLLRAMAPPDRRGSAFGLFDMLVSTSAAVGPLVGGLLVSGLGWRSMFVVAVPVAIFAAVAVGVVTRPQPVAGATDRRATPRPIDLPGLGLLAGFLVSLLLGLRGLENGGTEALGLLAAPMFLLVFVLFELRSPHPAVDPRLFASRPFAAAVVGVFGATVILHATLVLVPLLVERVLGGDAQTSGFVLLGISALGAVGAPIGGRVSDAVGRRLPAVLGMVGCVVGLVALWLVAPEASTLMLGLLLALVGFGLGLSGSPRQTAALEIIEPERVGMAAGTNLTGRYIGGALLGATLAGAVLGGTVTAAGVSTGFGILAAVAVGVTVASLFLPSRRRVEHAEERLAAEV